MPLTCKIHKRCVRGRIKFCGLTFTSRRFSSAVECFLDETSGPIQPAFHSVFHSIVSMFYCTLSASPVRSKNCFAALQFPVTLCGVLVCTARPNVYTIITPETVQVTDTRTFHKTALALPRLVPYYKQSETELNAHSAVSES